jgi:2-polyprenyl-3-methyl-5-hydroxy-6-metoxy-1,4-benzoquinol methylase
MKPLDRRLQRWRIAQAAPFIPDGSRVLDIGCHDGALFRQLASRLGAGVGVDPLADDTVALGAEFRLVRGAFPDALPGGDLFDVVTCLAVLEHVPASEQRAFVAECGARLKPGGRLIITVPAPAVDGILRWLLRLRLVEGMSLEQHHGFDPEQTLALAAAAGLERVTRRRFQLGLNNLFVFRRPPPAS